MTYQTQANTFFHSKKYHYSSDAPIVVCDRLQTPENIGAIIRLAGNVGCEQVYFVRDNQAQQELRESKIKKLASTAFDTVNWSYCSEEELLALPELQKRDWVALETCSSAQNLFKLSLPEQLVLVVGNEAHGISDLLLRHCSQIVYIPLVGACKSMNVSQALGIGLMHWVSAYLQEG